MDTKRNSIGENSTRLEKTVIDLERKYKKLLSDLEQRTAVQRKNDSQVTYQI